MEPASKRSKHKTAGRSLFEQPFEVSMPDYFVPNCRKKFLHFFQNDEKKLHLLDLENHQWKFKVVNLDISFKIPHFHKSITTPFGDTFLIGGSHPDNI